MNTSDIGGQTNSDWELFLITLEQKNTNKHKESESAAHTVSMLTTYRGLYTFIYILESFLLLVQPPIVTQKYTTSCTSERKEQKSKRKRPGLSTVMIYIRKPTGHSLYISEASVFITKIGI